MRDLAGVDVLGSGWAETLQTDPAAVVDALWCIHEPEALDRGLNDRQFGRLLRPRDILDDAAGALGRAIVAFFPSPDDVLDDDTPPSAKKPDDDNEDTDDPAPLTWPRVFRLAGLVGVDPRPFSLAELLNLHRGAIADRSRLLWSPASAVASAALRGRVKPSEINPWTRQKAPDFTKPRTRPLSF